MSTDIGGDKTMTVKSTVNLNKYYKEQLDLFVSMKRISSVTEGTNAALEAYVKKTQKDIYESQMRAAAQDKNFIERTMSAQRDFDAMDNKDRLLEEDEW